MAEPTGKSLEFRRVGMVFDTQRVLEPTDLAVASGEFLTLLGPSGSGKSTLLTIAAGYLDPTEGRVLIGERDVTRVAPRHRNIGMVFQNYALFPHLNVRENVGYGPKVRGVPRPEHDQRIAEALEVTQMQGFADRSIQALSGGQRQRVALARAVAAAPDVILMDEPLGALDRQLRKQVQLEIRRLHEVTGRTTIYVTHDQEEALVMSDRIAVLRQGRIAQIGTPEELYNRPDSRFISEFLGESNVIRGVVREVSNNRAVLQADGLGITLRAAAANGLSPHDSAAFVVRPEHVRLVVGTGRLQGQVRERIFLGEITAYRLTLPDGSDFWSRQMTPAEGIEKGTQAGIEWAEDKARIVPL